MRHVAGRLRIIGGSWRSRIVEFDQGAGVRPTPDRVRQTLFDWLSPLIEGANCLDLFAGSGALGFEALSRGARHVSFVEHHPAQVQALRAAAERLQAGARASIFHAEALAWLQGRNQRYDIVFLDPPYAAGLVTLALRSLAGQLSPLHRIYLEWPGDRNGAAPLVEGFEILREKRAGQVSYGLAVQVPKVSAADQENRT